MKTDHYKMVESSDLRGLSVAVNDHIDRGWRPLGAPFRDREYLFQAVVRDDKDIQKTVLPDLKSLFDRIIVHAWFISDNSPKGFSRVAARVIVDEIEKFRAPLVESPKPAQPNFISEMRRALELLERAMPGHHCERKSHLLSANACLTRAIQNFCGNLAIVNENLTAARHYIAEALEYPMSSNDRKLIKYAHEIINNELMN